MIILAGAYVLYDKLGDSVTRNQMVVFGTSEPTAEVAPTSAATEATEAPVETPVATNEPMEKPTDEPTEEPTEALTEEPVDTEEESEEEVADKTIPAPDFTVYDKDGNPVTLSEHFGKPIVLNFWASWCGPCKMEMPDFNAKYLEVGDEITFMMVNLTDGGHETVESASKLITEAGYEFPVYYDTASFAAATYGVYSIPTTYFINADGNLVAQASGAIDASILQQGIDMIK